MCVIDSEEKKILSTILTKLENIEAKIDEINYPPEEAIRRSFIKKVEAAEKVIKEGKVKKMSSKEFKKKFSPSSP